MRGTHRDIHGQIGNESDGQLTDDVKRINPHIDRHIIEENRDRPLVPPPNYNKHMLHRHVPNYVSQTKDSDNNVPVTQSDVLDLEQQLEILRYKFNSLMKDVKPPAIHEKAYDSCIQINDMLSRSREHLHTEPVVRGGGELGRLQPNEQSTDNQKVKSQRVIKPIALPDAFTGTRSECWEDWVQDFELYASINEWSNTQRLKFLPICLKGAARKSFNDLSKKNDFQKVMLELRKRFAPECYAEVHKIKFRNRRRVRNENLFELALDLRKLAKQAYPTRDAVFIEESVREQFVEALQSRDLRIRIRQAKLTNLDELVAFAVEHEAYETIENNRAKDTTNVHSTNTRDNVQCWKCGKAGHIQRYCRSNLASNDAGRWDFLRFPPPGYVPSNGGVPGTPNFNSLVSDHSNSQSLNGNGSLRRSTQTLPL